MYFRVIKVTTTVVVLFTIVSA